MEGFHRPVTFILRMLIYVYIVYMRRRECPTQYSVESQSYDITTVGRVLWNLWNHKNVKIEPQHQIHMWRIIIVINKAFQENQSSNGTHFFSPSFVN